MLILASSSPRRRQLLSMLGVRHRIDPAAVEESIQPGETARDAAARLSRLKAEVVSGRHEGSWVLGADTVVAVGDALLGKPRDDDDAVHMLGLLSGGWHEVHTAVTLCRDGRADTRSAMTRVRVRGLTAAEIRAYVATGEPADRAGAYAAQGIGAALIDRIEGDFFTVVGFPVETVVAMLSAHGIGHVLAS